MARTLPAAVAGQRTPPLTPKSEGAGIAARPPQERKPAVISRLQDSPPWGGRQGFVQFPVVRDPLGLIMPVHEHNQDIVIQSPVRKPRPNRFSVTGWVPFQYLGRTVRYESSIERDFLTLLKKAGPPVAVIEQPLQLSVKALGFRGRPYHPDFLVYLLNPDLKYPKAVLVEIKPDSVLAKEELRAYRQRFLAARRFARRNGWGFRLLTAGRLRSSEVPVVPWPEKFVPPTPLRSPMELLHTLFPWEFP
jgi:hypothetical protein